MFFQRKIGGVYFNYVKINDYKLLKYDTINDVGIIMRNINVFIVLSLLVLGMLGYKVYEYNQQMKFTQKTILHNEIHTVSEFIEAFRTTYQEILDQVHIDINETTLELLPVKSLPRISQRFFEQKNKEVLIRSVSDQPCNPLGMANPFELEMIETTSGRK